MQIKIAGIFRVQRRVSSRKRIQRGAAIYIWNFDTRFVNFGFHSSVIYWRHNVGDSAWKMDSRRTENGTKERKQMHYASLPSTQR